MNGTSWDLKQSLSVPTSVGSHVSDSCSGTMSRKLQKTCPDLSRVTDQRPLDPRTLALGYRYKEPLRRGLGVALPVPTLWSGWLRLDAPQPWVQVPVPLELPGEAWVALPAPTLWNGWLRLHVPQPRVQVPVTLVGVLPEKDWVALPVPVLWDGWLRLQVPQPCYNIDSFVGGGTCTIAGRVQVSVTLVGVLPRKDWVALPVPLLWNSWLRLHVPQPCYSYSIECIDSVLIDLLTLAHNRIAHNEIQSGQRLKTLRTSIFICF